MRKGIWRPLRRESFGGCGGTLAYVCFPAHSALGVALVLSLLFVLLLRLVAGPLVFVLIIGVLGVLAYGIYHCWNEYRLLRDKGASISQLGFTTNLSAYSSVQETWLAARECPAHPRTTGCPRAAVALTRAPLLPPSTLSDPAGCA